MIPPVLIDALAAIRLTRLIVDDKLTEPVRERIWRTHPPTHGLGFAVACPHCTAMYVAAGVLAARRWKPRWWQPVAELLALAAVVGETAARL